MCALRTVNAAPTLAYSYRLNIKTRKPTKTVVQRDKPLDDSSSISTSLPSILISEPTPRDYHRYKSIPDDIDEWLEYDSEEDLEDYGTVFIDPAIKTYDAICKQNKCIPISSVKTGLVEERMSCRYVKLDYRELHSICTALCVSCHVEHVEFEQNDIGVQGVRMLREVVDNCSYLTHVTIKNNGLKSEGARLICEAVKNNQRISYLDISGNGFVESDGKYFRDLIQNSYHLRELYLGNNCLREEGIKEISKALAKSCTLIVLDLNWNHIRMEGAKAIGDALQTNSGLEKLNLSWNGLHEMGAEAIAQGLKKNDTLVELDLTCNRLSELCLAEIMNGLDYNTTLQTLRIGKNHITTKGATSLLQMLRKNTESGITLLDLCTQEVDGKFESEYEELLKERNVEVTYGMVWRSNRKSISSADETEDEAALLGCNPLTVLMECMRLQNFRLVDFFKSLDTNKSNFICITELCEGLLKLQIPINRRTMMKLLTRLDKDGNKLLDFGEMIAAQRLYKQQWRKIMAGDVDFEQTEIGKITLHLRRIMGSNYIRKKKENDSLLVRSADRSRASSANWSRASSANKSRETSPKVNGYHDKHFTYEDKI